MLERQCFGSLAHDVVGPTCLLKGVNATTTHVYSIRGARTFKNASLFDCFTSTHTPVKLGFDAATSSIFDMSGVRRSALAWEEWGMGKHKERTRNRDSRAANRSLHLDSRDFHARSFSRLLSPSSGCVISCGVRNARAVFVLFALQCCVCMCV